MACGIRVDPLPVLAEGGKWLQHRHARRALTSISHLGARGWAAHATLPHGQLVARQLGQRPALQPAAAGRPVPEKPLRSEAKRDRAVGQRLDRVWADLGYQWGSQASCDIGPRPGWEALSGASGVGHLAVAGSLRTEDAADHLDEYHPSGTSLWSPDAPIALGWHPYKLCSVWACAECNGAFLRYTVRWLLRRRADPAACGKFDLHAIASVTVSPHPVVKLSARRGPSSEMLSGLPGLAERGIAA